MRLGRDSAHPKTKPKLGEHFDASDPLAPFACALLADGAGTTVFDVALGQASSPAINEPRWFENEGGPALRFASGSSQSLKLPLRGLVSVNNAPFTVAVLFRSTDAGTTAMGLYAEGSTASANPLLLISLNNGLAGRIQSTVRDGAGTSVQLQSDLGLNDGRWHTVHLVNEGAGGLLLHYVDGVLQASAANTLSSNMAVTTPTLGAAEQNAGPTSFLSGDLGFLMSWKRRLSSQEVMQHARAPYSMFRGERISGRGLPGLTEWRIQDTDGVDMLVVDRSFPTNPGEEILRNVTITKADEFGAYCLIPDDALRLFPWSNIRWIRPASRLANAPTNRFQNRSGTIAVPSVSQEVMPVNSGREYLAVQNVSDTTMWINFTIPAACDQPSIQIEPEGSFVMEEGFVTNESVNIICTASGKSFTAYEG